MSNPPPPITLKSDKVYVANVSGGRSSAYMLRLLLDAWGEIPDNVIVAFMNTGKEREETLEFLARIESEWRLEMLWLEYRYHESAKGGFKDPKNTFAVVDFESASRNGEPFEQLIRSRNYLPNATQRICTHELKVNTLNRYMKHVRGINSNQYVNVIGIRKDERKRVVRLFDRKCNIILPLYHAGVTLKEVEQFWNSYYFDLPFPSSTSLYTNCDLCFMKGKYALTRIIRDEPERAKWWVQMEQSVKGERRKKKNAQFRKEYSIQKLINLANEPLLFEEEEGGFSCFCGD